MTAGPLLFMSLFFNWQMLEIDYGPCRNRQAASGWLGRVGARDRVAGHRRRDFVVLVQLTEVEMSEDVPWETVTLALGSVTLAFAVLKNLNDANSTWASYGRRPGGLSPTART